MNAHLEDARFRESLRVFREMSGDNDRMLEFGALDWNYLGIAEGTGSVEFHGEMTSSGLDVSHINAAELGVGRSSILLILSPDTYARQTWSRRSLEAMTAAGDDVFFYCDMDP